MAYEPLPRFPASPMSSGANDPISRYSPHENVNIADDALRAFPEDLARFIMRGASKLHYETRIDNNELFHIARQFSTMNQIQKELLMQRTLQGIQALPPPERADFLREGIGILKATAMPQHADHASQARGSRYDYGGSAAPPARTRENLAQVIQATGIDSMTDHEAAAATESLYREIGKAGIGSPDTLIEMAAELRPEERRDLSDTLVQIQVIPPGKREVVDDAMEPGGHLDQINRALSYWKLARDNVWMSVALPIGELIFCFVMSFFPSICEAPLLRWMKGDGTIGLAFAMTAYYIYHVCKPAIRRVQTDPAGVANSLSKQWMDAQKNRRGNRDASPLEDFIIQLIAPRGIANFKYEIGVSGAILLLLVIMAICWIVVGVLQILGLVAWSCSLFVIVVTLAVVALRLFIFFFTAYLVLRAYNGYARHEALHRQNSLSRQL